MKEKLSNKLIKKAQDGDIQAREEILNACEFIVISEVNKMNVPKSEIEDLQQIARYAIYVSIDRYDESYNTSFETFATICVHNKLLDAIKLIPPIVVKDDDNDGETDTDNANEGIDEDLVRVLKKLFTPTEFKILMLWSYGYSYNEIIEDLNIKHTKIANTITKLKTLKDKIKEEAGL